MSVRKPKALSDVWENASSVLGDSLRKLDQGVDRKRYMRCYSDVFNYLCANSDGEHMYMKFRALLQEYVKELVDEAKPLPDEQLLLYFRKKWNEYRVSNRMSNSMLNYLNRTWVKTSKSNNEDVFEISMLADVMWKDHMFLPLHKRLTGAMLALIKADRNGETIQAGILADTANCYVRLGTNKESPKQSTLEVYKAYFEKDFIAASDVYYTVESTNFIHENGVSEYMKKAERRLAEETQRVRNYLHASTNPVLQAKLDEVLIKKHMPAMHEKAAGLLEEEQRDDLARMYSLLARLGDDGLNPVRDALQTHIAAAGRHALEAEAEQASSAPDVFVAILLRVFRKYKALVEDAFQDDAGFVAAQDKAFRDFVNKNAVTKQDRGAVVKAPQMLAKYCDMILKKGPKHISDENEMEQTLEDVVALFKYLPDKDIFMLVYSKLLSKRLIHDNSGNSDYEAAMINKLKTAQGFEYTSRLQRMVQDIATSKDINAGFKDFIESNEEKLSLDFSVNVLATGCWPLQPPSTPFNVPEALVNSVSLFKKFYNTKYQGRKLTYLHHLSKAEISVKYAMKGRLRVMTSTFQMGVLLHFDTAGADIVTLGDLRSATMLEEQPLKIGLLSMLKMRFMKCSDGVKHVNWTDATKFALTKNFASKRNRVNLNVPVAVAGLRSAPQAAVEAPEIRRERELKLQAAIVRIMKARKTMDHNMLLSETTTQVQKWFQPKVSTIKKVVEHLIDQDYLKRCVDENNNSLKKYDYVA